jgi:carbon storage regulator CsrA
MLVLGREAEQSVILTVPPSNQTQYIEVIVNEIRASSVRLGFEAAPEVEINRREVQEEIDQQRNQGEFPCQ